MNCERTLPLLPLVALDAAEADDRTAVLAHAAGCARCAAALRELESARAALSSFTVEAAPATDSVALRAEAGAPVSVTVLRGRRRSGLVKAAAAALVVAAALGFAWLHGELTFERGAASLRIAWRTPAPSEDLVAPADGFGLASRVELAAAVDDLARQLKELEERHERDLLLLAGSVDRQQLSRDRGVERRMRTLEEQTLDGFIYTNEVIDHVVGRLAQSGGDDQK